jgi:hypothetical protein
VPTKQLRFEGPTMEEARRRAHDQLGADMESARVVRSGKERYGGLYGFFQQQRFVIEMEVAVAPATRKQTVTSTSFESLLDETTDTVALSDFDNELERELELVIADATTGATSSALAHGRSSLPAHEHGLESTDFGAKPAPSTSPAGPNRYLDTTPPRNSAGPPAPSTPPPDRTLARLVAAGLRAEYLPEPDGSDPGVLLAQRLASIPTVAPPALGAGEVVVIVGAVVEASEIASRLAALSPSPSAVIVASHRRVPASLGHARANSPEEAGTLVFAQRLEGGLSVVIVDVGCRDEFVAHAVKGLHPATIWGVVPASSSDDEVDELAARTGRLDAIALFNLLVAERPATLIGEKWPIAYVDGWRASPLTLAARLLEAVGVRA